MFPDCAPEKLKVKLKQLEHAPIPGHNELFHGDNKVSDEVEKVLEKVMEDSGMGPMSRAFKDEYRPEMRVKGKTIHETSLDREKKENSDISGGIYSHEFVHRDNFDASQCATDEAIKDRESCKHAEQLKHIVSSVLGLYMDFNSTREEPRELSGDEDYNFCR